MGALCSRGATASAKAPGLTQASNNNGQSPHPASTDNHSTGQPAFATAQPVGPAPVVLDGMRSAAEPGGAVPQAAHKQVLALEQHNRALQSELSQAKASLAQQLQEQQQREAVLKAQVAEAQRRVEEASRTLKEHASAREGLERTVAELRLKCESLNSLNQQLKRRVSHVVTGHSEERDMHAAQQADMGQQSRALVVLRDSNADSQLPLLWTAADSKRWQGVRMEGGDVTGLALSSMMVYLIPPEIGKLTSLTALLLSNNHIKRLPPAIKNLKQLTYLLLDGNELVDLPEEIAEVSQLQTLWLHDNKLISLPGSIGRLRELRQLLLSNNALMSLPESVGELTNLSSLWLDNNRLEVLPQSIRKLTMVHRLRVDSHLLQQLPPEMVRLTQEPATGGGNVAAGSPADGSMAGGSGSGADAYAVTES